jgi:Domain of unknown function (DUF4911)
MLNTDYNNELWYLQLPHEKIVELIWILEGYEGLAVPRVLDKARGIVELLTAPDLHEVLKMVLEDLDKTFGVKRVPRPDGVKSIADEEYLS